MKDIKKYAKQVFDKNNKSGIKNVHDEFISEYQRLVSTKDASGIISDCPIGDYCGYNGCYRHMICDFKDSYPGSKNKAMTLGLYEEVKS